jgi:hypothetical protein
MATVNALKQEIEALSEEDYAQLRQWFSEKDWLKWDEKIGEDSEAGKLDFLVNEAFEEKDRGALRDL